MEKKWIVEAKYDTRKDLIASITKSEEDPEDFDISDYMDVEISVIKSTNKHSIQSYGWGGKDKIIIFEVSGDEGCSEIDFKWYKKVAKILCNELNEWNM